MQTSRKFEEMESSFRKLISNSDMISSQKQLCAFFLQIVVGWRLKYTKNWITVENNTEISFAFNY